MPRWQKYEVNVSDGLDSVERTTQVKFENGGEMAGDSPKLATARFARRSTSPESSASTERASSSSYSGGEEGMTKRKEVVQISSSRISSKKSANSKSQSICFTAICGWLCACIMGIVSLTFVLLIYLLPTQGVFPVGVQLYQKSDVPIVRQGSLKIYPGFNSSRFEHTISLDLADAFTNNQEIVDVIDRYPGHNASVPLPPPYVHCWPNNPTRDHPCFFHKDWLEEVCSEEDFYGYHSFSPYINACFLLRIEESGSWTPEPIKPEYVGDSWRHEYDPTFLGVGCKPKEGDTSGVTFEKHPSKGFSVHYFPVNSFSPDLYLTPAVMVQVKGVPRNRNVTIECWIRAHNKLQLTDSGNIIINFVHTRSEFLAKPSKISSSSSTESEVVNTARLVQSTDKTSSTNTISRTISSTANTLPTANYSNETANASLVIVDSNETSDYTDYEDENMSPM